MSSEREDAGGPGTPNRHRRGVPGLSRRVPRVRRREAPETSRRRAGPRPPRLAARWGLEPSALPSLEEEERHASWLELFFDLVFVLALVAVQERLHDATPSPGEILYTAGLFAVVWWAWGGQAFYDTRFDPDDFTHRLAVLVGMLGAGAMAIGAEEAPTTLLLPIGYLVVRGTLLVLYLRVRGTSPGVRELTTVYLVGFGTGWLLWAASLATPVDVRPLLWIVALTIELLTPWLGRRRLVRHPVHPLHLPERIGQFTIILLGVSLTDLLDAVPGHPTPTTVLSAAVAFAIPASVWWVYTTFVTIGLSSRRLRAGVGYSAVHGVLGAALLLLGWALGQIVRDVAAGAGELPGILRLLVAVSLCAWIGCGLALQRISLGRLPRQRLVLAALGVVLVVAVTVVATEPVSLLPLLALVLVGYAIVVSRLIVRFAEHRPAD
ncbi:low temperature requirement protein A [Plantactinospora sonchi]|uniref:Low temperature requirement protein A n=1 Tax=Plantactinospora sonchi TaxID=1544735 RepID=A0ABU7RX75_9ACTN